MLTELSFDSAIETKIDLPLQILQGAILKKLCFILIFISIGIATATIVYVVFFEIIPKAKTVGGTGKQHILAMVLGFAIFLPSLYFRK